ncbi:VanW family protein [Nocardioides deserti]|uniref:VanW family protein n=1 Tax=Nocardioides deserti TaxID=1588644 RepID=A0ABR6U7T9_9ACTN|nr:VanW family protein [Nocardioides deserti]MBC2960440.1 VanW family protein [Nocardioides deserti]
MTEPQTAPSREKAGGRAVLLVLLGLVVLVGAGWVAAYAMAGDKVPRGTTVAGVGIGGKTPDDAVAALRDGLADRAAEPFTLTAAGETFELDPATAGVTVDHEESVAEAGGGRSWDPRRLWAYYTDGDDLDAVVEVDDAALAEALAPVEGEVGRPARDAAVSFEGSRVVTREPRTGEEVDRQALRDDLVAAYLSEDPTVELPLVEVEPEVDEADLRTAVEEFANPAMSGPVTLVFGDSPVRLLPRQFGPLLSMTAEDGALVPEVDEAALEELVGDAVGDDGAPVDATVVLRNGKPRVVPAKPGVSYDPEEVSATFLDLVTREEGERELEVEAQVAEPEFTTADARKLNIKEQVSTFTTYYPHAEYRNVNLGRAAELVDGTLLKPGETFSLNDTVGERTAENGFTEGFVINDGILVEDLGGGVSQMATTLFNAMFFAGLEDVEHKPHSFYIDRYPVGREATVAWGALDLRFRNDTEHGVLIDAKVSPSSPGGQGAVTVSLWSTKVWDITSTTSDRYAYTAPETRTLTTDDCYPNTGYSGFQVDVVRYFKRPGQDEVVKREEFHTTYTPSDTVVCK